MMYSLNFGFWLSASFFSPDDVTSGFTGSGGFSLLWGPFVQPCKEKATVLDSQTSTAHATMATAKVAVNEYENNRQWKWKHDHGGFKVWIEMLDWRQKLTTMLRKSEKSVVLLLQQDHPWRKF